MRHAICSGFIALAIVSAASSVHADDSNIAEQLFREGKRLLAEGKTAEACKAFEGSYRKDEAATTLLNLADCREKNGQYATAWGYFLDVERLGRTKPDAAAYRDTAKARAAKLEGRLSYLIINVPADANVEGLQILRNGKVVDPAEWNTDIPIDGGEYAIEGKAPGYEAWATKVTVKPERDKASVNVPRFRSRPESGEVGGVETDPPPGGGGGGDVGGGGRNKTGLVIAAGGGVMLLGGLTLGYLAKQKYGEAEDICGTDHVCDTADEQDAANELTDQARMRGNISTVATGAGVIAIGVGTFLWLRSGSSSKSSGQARLQLSPVIAPDSVGLVLGGSL
ncbi:MAG TPA: hypothetical protein VM261_15000 [Kofleriaceae bacterium]|nr:hypothetical protein [Kofleriaceae bacterium]